MDVRRRTPPFLLAALGLMAACNKTPSPAAEKETPVPSAVPTSSASAASVEKQLPAPEDKKPKEIPTLVPQDPNFKEGSPSGVFAIEGATAVVDGLKVGRIVDDHLEWIATLYEDESNKVALGGSRIQSVHGRYPDAIDVLYTSNQGRALRPTIYPLTGKGAAHTAAPGGGLGDIVGTAALGTSTLAGSVSPNFGGVQFVTIRGPGLVIKPQTPEKAGCESKRAYFQEAPAVVPDVVAATPKGTLLSFGDLCKDYNPALEVWDQPGKSRIIELVQWIKKVDWDAKIFLGTGDEAFLYAGEDKPILHYRDGKVEPLPRPGDKLKNVFVSPQHKLFASDGAHVYRWDDTQWTIFAHLNWSVRYFESAMDEKENIWVTFGGVQKLVPGPSIDYKDGCTTPFVYMYEVSRDNDDKFTFPTTRKALASFEGVADLGLVDFHEQGRRLGITVKSKEQGEALIAHIHATMKNEHPRLICYAPSKPRVIEIKPKGK